MQKIDVQRPPKAEELERLGVRSWPIWEKEVSEFPWTYDEREICYFLEGEVEVLPDGAGQQAVRIQRGDLVTFPAGMSCTWKVKRPVRKHYRFG